MARPEVVCLHNYKPGHDKFYTVRVDWIGGSQPFRVVVAFGPIGRPKAQSEQTKGEFATLSEARRLQNQWVNDKKRGGYIDLEDSDYRGGYSRAGILEKIDMTRCYTEGMQVVANRLQVPAPPVRHIQPEKPSAGRSGRVVGI